MKTRDLILQISVKTKFISGFNAKRGLVSLFGDSLAVATRSPALPVWSFAFGISS